MQLKLKLLFIIFLFANSDSFAQTDDDCKPIKLLYIVEAQQNFMVPFIETQIRKLTFAKSNIPICDSIISFNSFADQRELEGEFVKRIIEFEHLENLGAILKGNDARSKQIANQIKTSDQILKIKINTFNDLIEYQFSLYKRIPDKKRIILSYLKGASVFINPKSSDYDSKILMALKQVFEKSNEKPIVHFKSNISIYYSTIFCTTEDTVILEPNISDNDSREEDYKYFWEKFGPNSQSISLENTSRIQTIIKPDSGIYSLIFSVFDGISFSKKDTIILAVRYRPKIESIKSHYNRNSDITFKKSWHGSHTLINSHDFFLNILSNNITIDDTSQLHVICTNELNRVVFKIDSNFVGYCLRIKTNNTFSHNTLTDDRGKNYRYQYSQNQCKPISLNMDSVKLGTYNLEMYVVNNNVKSNVINEQILVKEMRATSIYYNWLIFPIKNIGLLNTPFNLEIGTTLSLNKIYSVTFSPGISIGNQISRKFFAESSLNANLPNLPVSIGITSLYYQIPQDHVIHLAFGFKYSYCLIPSSYGMGKVGLGFLWSTQRYPSSHSKFVLAINYGMDIYWNKKRK